MGLVKRIQKQIDKFGLTNDDLQVADSQRYKFTLVRILRQVIQ